MAKEVKDRDVRRRREATFTFIGGPCVIEGREITLRIAEAARRAHVAPGISLSSSSLPTTRRTGLRCGASGVPDWKEGLEILGSAANRRGARSHRCPFHRGGSRCRRSRRCPPGAGAPLEADGPARRMREDGQGRQYKERAVHVSPTRWVCDRQGGIDREQRASSSPNGERSSATTTWSMISGHSRS